MTNIITINIFVDKRLEVKVEVEVEAEIEAEIEEKAQGAERRAQGKSFRVWLRRARLRLGSEFHSSVSVCSMK